MAIQSTVSKDELDASKEASADVKAAAKAAADAAKREADERAATKAHLSEILLLRGLARAASPHGSENLAAALDGIANALASGAKLDGDLLIDVAYALKNSPSDWNAMVKKIDALLLAAAETDKADKKATA